MLRAAHVNAFVAEGVRGNPAAVVLVSPDLWNGACNDLWMQRIARQFGLSETAFVTRAAAPGAFKLRWFTPTKEVSLCGHATLATGHALLSWSKWTVESDTEIVALKEHLKSTEMMNFETLSGILGVSFKAAEGEAELLMSFPLNAPAAPKSEEANKLYRHIAGIALGGVSASALDEVLESVVHNSTTNKLIVRLKDDKCYAVISEMKTPDPAALLAIDQSRLPKEERVTGVSITSSGVSLPREIASSLSPSSPVHFFSRYFSPWNGIPEDPVNGSSHTILAPFWADALGLWKEDGPSKVAEMTALQLSSKPAGGVLKLKAVQATGERGASRVEIGGLAATVYQGTIAAPTMSAASP
jgi:PhzF family phenazine biosynthesis protein